MPEIIYLFLAGIVGGFFAGLLGIGGGIIYVLILPIALGHAGVPMSEMVQYTIANSILGTFFASASGNIQHVRKDDFYWKEVCLVSIPAIILAFITLFLVVYKPWYPKDIFNIILVTVLFFIIYRAIARLQKIKKGKQHFESKSRAAYTLAGGGSGIIASLTGLGGGAILIPALTLGLSIDMKKAKSISLGMIMFSSLFVTLLNMWKTPENGIEYWTKGYIVFPIAIPMALGVVLASPLGVKISHKLSSKTITLLFVIFLSAVIVKKLLEIIY